MFGASIFIIVFLTSGMAASDFKEVESADDVAATVKIEKSAEGDSAADTESKKNPDEVSLSGTVNVIRKISVTEVFFKDLKDSYVIPSGSQHSQIYKALEESRKKGTPVSFRANSKSRRIVSIESGSSEKKAPAVSEGVNDKSGSK